MVLFSFLLFSGCSYIGKKHVKNQDSVTQNDKKLEEESRALTDAALKSSRKLSPSLATDLVQSFLEEDQRVEGLPLKPFDVDGLFASNKVSWAEMKARYTAIRGMESERARLNSELDETQKRLVELGKKYEEERNKSIIRRTWTWAVSTLGIGGTIALCVFFPFLIPIFGSIFSSVISVMPKLVSFFGVVGKSTFDSVLAGVQKTREKLKKEAELPENIQPKYTPQELLDIINTELHKETDKKDRDIIEARKSVVRSKM